MIRIVYDGDCPFCVGYTKYTRLRQRYGEVELIDARAHPELMADYAAKGFEIDESFIVDVQDEILTHGAAMAYIHANLAPRWTGLPFIAKPKFLNRVYPALRGTRNLTLRLLGRQQIRRPHAGSPSTKTST